MDQLFRQSGLIALLALGLAGCNTPAGGASRPLETTVANGTPVQIVARCGGDPVDVQVDWNLGTTYFAWLVVGDAVDPSTPLTPGSYKLACTKGTKPNAWSCASDKFQVAIADDAAALTATPSDGTQWRAPSPLACDPTLDHAQ